MKKLPFAPLLAALVAAPAWAGTGTRVTELAPPQQSDAFRQVVEVQATRNPAAVIARDARPEGARAPGGTALAFSGRW
jgi:hypothetical protein